MSSAGIPNDLEAQMAQKLLWRAKRKKDATWESVAKKFRLKGRAQAYQMAMGNRPVVATMRGYARQALLKKRLARRLMKQGAEFLAARQVSKSGCYLRGGKPAELGWD